MSVRRAKFEALLRLFRPGRLVDLGAGHGGFSRRAADLGWEVTAVDVRTERWPKDPRVTWVQADVRSVDLEPYDLILCLGVFYHLPLKDQLDLLCRARAPMIIDTHLDHGAHTHAKRLSTPLEMDGYRGRLYREGKALTSSWGNEESFWPTLESFHRMLMASGFPTVLTLEPWLMPDRTFFLALPG